MSFADIRGQFPNLNAAQVDDTLQRLSRRELIQVSLGEQLVELVPEGKFVVVTCTGGAGAMYSDRF